MDIASVQFTQSRFWIIIALSFGVGHGERGDDLGAVLLDLLSPAAAVAALPPPQVNGDVVFGQQQPRGHPFDDDDEALAV
jgi:hypothetical protein